MTVYRTSEVLVPSAANPGENRFQLAARLAQGETTDAMWWQLTTATRATAIYGALRLLDEEAAAVARLSEDRQDDIPSPSSDDAGLTALGDSWGIFEHMPGQLDSRGAQLP